MAVAHFSSGSGMAQRLGTAREIVKQDGTDARRDIQNYRHSLSLNPRSANAWLELA